MRARHAEARGGRRAICLPWAVQGAIRVPCPTRYQRALMEVTGSSTLGQMLYWTTLTLRFQ
jgi:hypothetical protein